MVIKILLTKQKKRALKNELLIAGTLHSQLSEMEARNIVKYLGFEIFDGNFVEVMKHISGVQVRDINSNNHFSHKSNPFISEEGGFLPSAQRQPCEMSDFSFIRKPQRAVSPFRLKGGSQTKKRRFKPKGGRAYSSLIPEIFSE